MVDDALSTAASGVLEHSPEAKALAVAVGLDDVPRQVVGTWADRLYIRRERRFGELLHKAAARLKAQGIPPQAVRDRTLRDLMEHATLEEDPGLVDLWAGLLASAASGSETPPVYAQALSQLEPVEAQFLAAAAASTLARLPGSRCTLVDLPEFRGRLRWRHLDNLERLALITYTFNGAQNVPLPEAPYETEPLDTALSPTPLGLDFLAACGGIRERPDPARGATNL